MIAANTQPTHTLSRRIETESEHQICLERERVMLEEARESLRAGLFIADEDLDEWLDRFVAGDPLPIPTVPHTNSK